jgi:hypothetical protein
MPINSTNIVIDQIAAEARQHGYIQVVKARSVYLIPWTKEAVGCEEIIKVFEFEAKSMCPELSLHFDGVFDQDQHVYLLKLEDQLFMRVYVLPRKRYTYGAGDDSNQV